MYGGHLADHQTSDPAVPLSSLAEFCSFNTCKQVLIHISKFCVILLVGADEENNADLL